MRSESWLSVAPTWRWDFGSTGAAPPAALKATERPLVDFSGREISCAKGLTGCWSGSAARTGRSRFGAPASISKAWKPSFASTPSCATSPPWRGRDKRAADGEVNLVAYVSLRDGAPAGVLDELKELMRSVPPSMRPGRLYLTHKIPRLPSSKLDLRALMALG